MNRIVPIALLFAATSISIGAASAQEQHLEANVPFSFTVGAATVPAGAYKISFINEMIMRLESPSNQVQLLTMVQTGDTNASGPGKLVFHRYGSRYFLSDIISPFSLSAAHLPPTKAERKTRLEAQVAGVAVSEPVLVALN